MCYVDGTMYLVDLNLLLLFSFELNLLDVVVGLFLDDDVVKSLQSFLC